jgi:hypothetical protein
MNEILDLLAVPAERGFPAGQMAARRDALVAAVAAGQPQRRSLRGAVRAVCGRITRTWLALVAGLAVALVLLTASPSGDQGRLTTTSQVLLAAAGTAQLVAVVASPSALRPVETGGHQILISFPRRRLSGVVAAG